MRIVIVGAGSAGSVLAERLSRNPDCQVTLFESGPPADGPGLRAAHRLPIEPASPVAARFAATLTDHPARPVSLVRGAVVGGSGAINGGYFCRGRAADFDGWKLPGWSWDDVLPDFRAIETDHDFAGPLHGADGPIPVVRTRRFGAGTERFVEAALAHGFPWIDDLNGAPDGDGVGALPLNVVDGQRCGPGAMALAPALDRPNLDLQTGTRVVAVRFAGHRAVGVQVLGPDGAAVWDADRIVLCAGAISTAQLLMLSGCGPAGVLSRVGVPVRVDLPVGQNFADHPEWLLPTRWPATSGRTPLEAALSLGDVEIRLYTAGFAEMVGDPPADPPHLGVALMRPRVRGTLTLVSADPLVAPEIAHHYDSVAADVTALRDGAELARDLARLGDVEANWSTTQHLCGTAPMGSVLDAQCRVLGVDGLWVADGSIMPTITSRGPHASIAMIGHRVAPFVAR